MLFICGHVSWCKFFDLYRCNSSSSMLWHKQYFSTLNFPRFNISCNQAWCSSTLQFNYNYYLIPILTARVVSIKSQLSKELFRPYINCNSSCLNLRQRWAGCRTGGKGSSGSTMYIHCSFVVHQFHIHQFHIKVSCLILCPGRCVTGFW